MRSKLKLNNKLSNIKDSPRKMLKKIILTMNKRMIALKSLENSIRVKKKIKNKLKLSN